jgi:hypothetical protein
MNGHVATAPCSSEKLTVAIVVPAIKILKNIIKYQVTLDSLRYCGAFCTNLAQRYPMQPGENHGIL